MPQLPELATHFVDAANWDAVRREGLLSAASLMRRAGEEAARARRFRPAGETLPSGAFVRDQRPMPPEALSRCLDPPLSPEDWYELVNRGVYFWLDPRRAERHLRALVERAQIRLTVSVSRLLDLHGEAAYVTPFNIGSAVRRPAARGLRTLVPVHRWLSDGWASEASAGARARASSHPPAELVVHRDLPDLREFVVGVDAVNWPDTSSAACSVAPVHF